MERSKMYGIGASDVPTILGLNPFCTPLQLYLRLIGTVEPAKKNEPMYWGSKKEQIIAERFAEDHKVKLMAWKKRFYHPTMEFFSCELDRIIVGTDTNVECKSVNEYKGKDWDGETGDMPAYVIAQTQSQMGLSKRQKTWVACLIGSSDYREKLVEFDKEFWEMIERRVQEFWNMVENRIPPMAVLGDDDALLSLHPTDNTLIEANDDMNTAIARRQELSGQIASLEEEKELIEVKLKEVIGDNLGIKTSQYQVIWKPTKTTRIDVDKVKEAGLFEQYCTTTETRRLTIKLNKVTK